ncbi:hypothetical protein [Vibrio coralliirubri]|uniref:hypothetical protein n=1 Tax=Vibrio coralliirubri TaxID=1516159 RepID=UPI00076A1226|nr:hypothetical protein [Vibrio coralliirubri]
MLSWKSWKQKYSRQIDHVAGYEEAFVDKILSQIPEITPEDVFPQYHFIDDNGGNRYIDFMIKNESKGFYLPIELDGTYKDIDHQRWKDFLIRQNSLITKFGIVLRFSNKQMLWDSSNVITKIRNTLHVQAQNQATEDSKEKERDNLVSWYNKELSKLEDSNINSNDITKQIQELRSLVEELQLAQPSLQEGTDTKVAKKKNTSKRFGLGVLLTTVLAISFFINEFSNRTHDIVSYSSKPEVDIVKTTSEPLEVTEKIQFHDVNSWEEVPEDEIKSTLLQNTHLPAGAITSDMASQHIGTQQVVCGVVSQVTEFSRGTYLNFDQRFPDTLFNAVIWYSDSVNVLSGKASLNEYLNQKVCVSGEIGTYNGRSQIVVKSYSQLQKI